MIEPERLGYFHFWRQVGRRMNIKAIPESYDVLERFNRDYELRQYRYAKTNERVGTATRELFVGWLPRIASPLTRSAIHALLDDALIEGFGFPRANPVMRWLVPAGLRLRARIVRQLPPRKQPRLRTEMEHPSYPAGYTIEGLGPESMPTNTGTHGR
jgi:hypothetical protein